ncbi:AcrB/AcrD/AcrF family [Fusobacterium necrophorum subsp. necrophorum]|nr:AcrB/AcrD/AcrF family [Fusobacterium necrophorum subsp. necrophorum]
MLQSSVDERRCKQYGIYFRRGSYYDSIAKVNGRKYRRLNEKAKVALQELESIMPKGTKYNIIMDTSIDIKSSISGVSSNAIQGLIWQRLYYSFLRNVRATS